MFELRRNERLVGVRILHRTHPRDYRSVYVSLAVIRNESKWEHVECVFDESWSFDYYLDTDGTWKMNN